MQINPEDRDVVNFLIKKGLGEKDLSFNFAKNKFLELQYKDQ